jgi:outer membrane protein TolC
VQDTKQKFLSGSENNRDGAKSNNLNAGVELGWTIFDGMKMFATKNRLKELQDIGELRMRSQIELTFSRVIKAYMDVVLAKQQQKLFTETVLRSQKRFEFADDKFRAGKSAKTELLQAQVDLNTDKANKIRQETILKNCKAILNQLLARDVNTEFDVNETVLQKSEIKLEDLQQKAVSQNVGLQIAKKNQKVNLLSIKEVQAERMPSIQLKSGYNFNRSQSEAGFLQSSQSIGFHYGAGLSINLFNGYDVNRRLINNRLSFRSSELMYKDSLSKVQSAIIQAWNNYQGSLQLLSFEKQNIQVAEENYSIAEEQYKVGVITSIELRNAQINLINSKTRLLGVQYEAKLNETELLRLSGELLK